MFFFSATWWYSQSIIVQIIGKNADKISKVLKYTGKSGQVKTDPGKSIFQLLTQSLRFNSQRTHCFAKGADVKNSGPTPITHTVVKLNKLSQETRSGSSRIMAWYRQRNGLGPHVMKGLRNVVFLMTFEFEFSLSLSLSFEL